MTKKGQHTIKIYENEYIGLRKYCEQRGLIMAGIISCLVRTYLKEKGSEGFNESENTATDME